jgi:hypothetical protein
MDDAEATLLTLPGPSLVDRLLSEQDDVIRRLDELDLQILNVIASLTQDRSDSQKSAA